MKGRRLEQWRGGGRNDDLGVRLCDKQQEEGDGGDGGGNGESYSDGEDLLAYIVIIEVIASSMQHVRTRLHDSDAAVGVFVADGTWAGDNVTI